jgi:phage anti-repressor protein
MLNLIERDGKKYVSLIEFYDYNGFNAEKYHRWLKSLVTDQPEKIPVQGLDYVPVHKKQIGKGRKRKDYLITVEFLKTLCFEIKTTQASKVKHWADGITIIVLK